MKPQRIQLKRTKGWRMPPNTVKVDRSTRWGNPYVVTEDRTAFDACIAFAAMIDTMDEAERERFLAPLRGKNLACWCKLSTPGNCVWCHADILLDRANNSAPNKAINTDPKSG